MSKATVDQIAVSPGSVTSPSIFGTASSNTGFYFIDANTIGVTVNGLKVGEFNANGLYAPTQTAIFEYQLASGTGGGTATSGSWLTRPLNTTIRNDNSFATLSSNVITLASGSYIFKATGLLYNTDTSQHRIRNTSDGTTVALGTLIYLSNSSSSGGTSDIESGIITISSSKNFEMQYRVSNTSATIGLGNYSATFDEVSVFSRLIIEKVG